MLHKILKYLNLKRKVVNVDANELVKVTGRIMKDREINRGYRNIHERLNQC